jgi:hypothetical protein
MGGNLNNIRCEARNISGIRRGNARKTKLIIFLLKLRERILVTCMEERLNLREATNQKVT